MSKNDKRKIQTQKFGERELGKYIDPRINGRMFPLWILANFKEYKLPEVLQGDTTDKCSDKRELKLEKYQLFISKFLDYNSIYSNILIYHGLGTGKTGTTINIYNMLYRYTPGWNVFILLKAALKDDPWIKGIKKWLDKDDYEKRYTNIHFISYDSPFADKKFLETMDKVDRSKKSMYVIEECHNFISNVYSNINSPTGKRAQVIYEYIIRDKVENEGVRVVCLSATPAINTPFELAILFNLLRPGAFPKNENEFENLYISKAGYKSLNKVNKNMFQRRIMGLVSYYIGSDPRVYARPSTKYQDIVMSEYQEEVYSFYEDIEVKQAARMRLAGRKSKGYMSNTRQACNFVFPYIKQGISGDARPRPSNFKLSESEATALLEGNDKKLKLEKGTDRYINTSKYTQTSKLFVEEFNNYLRKINDEDKSSGNTISNDVNNYLTIHKGNYEEFRKDKKTKSKLYEEMYKCSAKFLHIIFTILVSPGPVLVYSNYVHMEGLELFKLYLKYFGIFHYSQRDKSKYSGYAEFHGNIDKEDRIKDMELFNKEENKLGEFIKIMLVSPAGTEGLSLASVRQVHIVEPYWHEVRITQMIGRAIRYCSHKYLPLSDRTVDIYRYKSIRKDRTKKYTADQKIEDLSRSKEGLLQSFFDAIKEVAIDCVLNKNHNMLSQDYKCFQFNEPSLFKKYIGPAYKTDMTEDLKYDNGSNSAKSITKKIKVIQIKAVKQLNKDDDDEDPIYTEKQDYWYYADSGVVYDFELKYPIGKVGLNEQGLPIKIDEDTFVITHVIPIPLIK